MIAVVALFVVVYDFVVFVYLVMVVILVFVEYLSTEGLPCCSGSGADSKGNTVEKTFYKPKLFAICVQFVFNSCAMYTHDICMIYHRYITISWFFRGYGRGCGRGYGFVGTCYFCRYNKTYFTTFFRFTSMRLCMVACITYCIYSGRPDSGFLLYAEFSLNPLSLQNLNKVKLGIIPITS